MENIGHPNFPKHLLNKRDELLMANPFESSWGFQLRYRPDIWINGIEVGINFLRGNGNDMSELFENNSGMVTQESLVYERYRVVPEYALGSAMTATRENMTSFFSSTLAQTSGAIVEIGAGNGLFSNAVLYPITYQDGRELILTEASPKQDGAFMAIRTKELSESTLDNVFASDLDKHFASNSVSNVVSIGSADVYPFDTMQDTARVISEVLAPGGRFIHVIDIGAGIGYTRKPDQAMQDFYIQKMTELGIPMSSKLDRKPNKSTLTKLGINKEEYIAYQAITNAVGALADYSMQELEQIAPDQFSIEKIDTDEYISEVFKSRSGELRQLVSKLSASIKEGAVNLELADLLEGIMYMGAHALRQRQTEVSQFLISMYSSLNHIMSLAYIQKSFEDQGMHLIGRGIQSSQKVGVPGQFAIRDIVYNSGIAVNKPLSEPRKESIQTVLRFIVLEKPAQAID